MGNWLERIFAFDILKIPPFRAMKGVYKNACFANTKVRRQAKALLFTELAEALRQGVPLDRALHLSSLPPPPRIPQGYGILNWPARQAVALIVAMAAHVFYLISASGFFDASRVARVLAGRLHERVERGFQLSRAMRICHNDFDAQETALVEVGERSGTLPAALRSLVAFQAAEERYFHQHAKLIYPVILFGVMGAIAMALLMYITPKFADIFHQLGNGVELPVVTQAVIEWSYVSFRLSAFLPLVSLLALFLFLRLIMNGSAMTRRVLIWVIFLATLGWGLPLSMAALSAVGSPGSPPIAVLIASVYLVLFFLLLPFILSIAEHILLTVERWIRSIFRALPLPLNPMRGENQARFLSSLAVLLQSGLPAHEALRLAGRTASPAIRARASRAAQHVETGLPIGEAALRARLFSRGANHRLAFLDRSDGYTDRLAELAQDMADDSAEVAIRFGWALEVAGVMLCGAMGLVLALAFYMPLFMIPNIMLNVTQ